ncbi:MAG: hypothetical protein WAN05_04305 [Roseiarcus sp.]
MLLDLSAKRHTIAVFFEPLRSIWSAAALQPRWRAASGPSAFANDFLPADVNDALVTENKRFDQSSEGAAQ